MTTQPLSPLTMLLSRHTRRREFITLLGSAAMAWPLAAYAQQPERMRRVGVLSNPGPDDAEMQSRTATFVQGLQQLSWTVGRNLQIDYRWSNGSAERLRAHAVELLALQPDVVLATSGVSIMPLLEASRSVPIVFAQTIDPVGLDVVESLSRPGGNITGFTQLEYSIPAKWLELLKQIAPATTHAAVLRDPFDPPGLGGGSSYLCSAPLRQHGRSRRAPRWRAKRAASAATRPESGSSARAQQSDGMRRIGVLEAFAEND